MRKTILTLGAAIIFMGSYCTSENSTHRSSDTATTKVDNVVTTSPSTSSPVVTDTQTVTLPKPIAKDSKAAKPIEKMAPPVVVADKPSVGGSATQIAAGGKLLAKSDCLACHNEVNKIVGPPYIKVAEKYAVNDANINYLVGKVISGGSGVWGAVPMSPHPNLAKADVKLMVQYILSLKK